MARNQCSRFSELACRILWFSALRQESNSAPLAGHFSGKLRTLRAKPLTLQLFCGLGSIEDFTSSYCSSLLPKTATYFRGHMSLLAFLQCSWHGVVCPVRGFTFYSYKAVPQPICSLTFTGEGGNQNEKDKTDSVVVGVSYYDMASAVICGLVRWAWRRYR